MASPYVCAVCGSPVRLGRHKSGWRHSSEGHYDHKAVKVAREEYMAAERTRVAIVMHADFATKLPALAGQFHVWVVETPANRRAAEALWVVGPGDRTHGVTTFKLYEGDSIESSVMNLLPVIDEHHADSAVVEVLVTGIYGRRAADAILCPT